MRKFYFFLLTFIFCAFQNNVKAQCNFSSSFGTATINPSGALVTISTCSFAGEYSTINGAVNGQTLQFTSSVATDYITVRSGTPGGPVLAYGPTPLSFANTFTGTIYAHWSANNACGAQSSCRTTTVQCTSCSGGGGPCTNTSSFGTATISPIGALVTISTCSFAGEYSTINGAVNGQTLRFTSSVATDFITVRSGTSNGPVVASGTTPLVFANTYTGTLYAHWNTPGCGAQSSCRTTTVQCTSCTPPPPPANDLCSGALTINCGQTLTGSTATATADAVTGCATTLNTAPGVWYTFAGDGSLTTLSLCGSAFDTKIGVFSGTCGTLTCVTSNDDFCGLQSQVTFSANVGTTYYVLVTAFSTNSGNYTLARTCIPACAGVPSPGAISPVTSTNCAGTSRTLTLSGYSIANGITFQWKSSPTSGGPYTNIAGATNDTYTFTTASTQYYVCTVTCTNGGGSATTAEVVVNVSNVSHSSITSNPATTCSPGASTISATATGGFGNYTHTLTGPGTIGAPVVSGGNNQNVSFNVTNIPVGANTYTLTSTDANGCSKASTVSVTVNQTPVITITPAAPVICAGNIQQLTANAVTGGSTTLSSGNINLAIPDNNAAGVTTAPISIPSGVTITNPADLKISINARHSWSGDLIFKVTSPCGTTYLFDRLGVPPLTFGNSANLGTSSASTPPPAVYTFDLAAATVMPESGPGTGFIPTGSYLPSNTTGVAHNWTGLTFPCAGTGNWTLNVSDNGGGDVGMLVDWSITYSSTVNSPVVFSPLTNVFTDAAATIPYTGTPVNTVWVKPPTTTTYTATGTVSGCTASANVTVTVNQLPAITVQPTPATQTVCPGANIIYSVSATGTGITYQWRRNGVNLVDGPQVLGSNTATLRLFNVAAANAGNYDCVVSGVCPPPATSNAVALVVASAPSVTNPANANICAIGATSQTSATFSVTGTGVPTPTIYQWQISTDGGGTWNNLANSVSTAASPYYTGVFTASLTVSNVPTSLDGARFRAVVTNSCAQSTNSGSATLTVRATPVVVANDLFNQRICISDTLVPLVGSPVGGAWTGIGVSGFNFVPTATAIGTYTLTYTYTNSVNCTARDTTLVKVVDCPERQRLLRDDAILVYPNPNNGLFNIRINSTLYNYLGMKVFDMTGRLVNGKVTKSGIDQQLVSPTWSNLVYGRVIPIDLTYLPSGNYLVEFYYDDGVRTSKKGYVIQILK